MGLLVLISSLKEANFFVEIYKPEKFLNNESDYLECAKQILSIDSGVIGFSTWCHSYPSSIFLAEKIKSICPSIPIIFGGPQASVLHTQTLIKHKSVDYILRGEAENSIKLLMKFLLRNDPSQSLSDIKGLTYRKGNKIISNSPSPIIRELDSLPVPAYERIFSINNLSIDVGRGCPFKCTYCSTNQFFSKRYRVKSIQRIIKEMDYCYKFSNITSFVFTHDMLTLDKKFMDGLCKSLVEHFKKTERKYGWVCSVRTDCVTKEMLADMHGSGCEAVFFGIESGSESVQKQIKKNLDIDYAHEIVEYSASLGIKTTVSYMIGFPGETKEDLAKTIKSILFCASVGAEPQMSVLSVLPGTEIFSNYNDKLEYDGISSGFSIQGVKNHLREKIEKDRELFSSFYYIPNKEYSRNLQIFICKFVNWTRFFSPTLLLLKQFLTICFNDFFNFDEIEKKNIEYKNVEIKRAIELLYLIDSIKKILIENRERLPSVIFSVFEADISKAFMTIKYTMVQQNRIAQGSMGNEKTRIIPEDIIEVVPVWEVVKLNHDILDIQGIITRYRESGKELPEIHNKYLIIGLSEIESDIVKFTKELSYIAEGLTNMRVSQFLEMCKRYFDNKDAFRILKKLMKYGMVEIKKKTETYVHG